MSNSETAEGPSPDRVRAILTGSSDSWGRWANSFEHRRYADHAPNRRRKCYCGCGGRITHVGLANGLAMMSGCELRVRRWVREG